MRTFCSLVIVGFLLAGCAQTSPTVAEPEAPVEPTPTATIDPLSVPDQLFGGECDAIFTAEEASALIGMVPVPKPRLVVPVTQFAGIECSWHAEPAPGPEPSGDPFLEMTALPVAAIDGVDDSTKCSSDDGGYGAFGACTFTAVIGEVVYSGAVNSGIGSTQSDASAALAAVIEALGHIDPSSPEIRERTAYAWPATVDCEELEESARIRDLFDRPGMQITQDGYEWSFAPVSEKLQTEHGTTECLWQNYDSGVRGVDVVLATIHADGAWVREYLAEMGEVTPVDIAGVDDALLLTEPSTGENWPTSLWVFDGTNALRLDTMWGELDEIYPAAPALVAALNGAS